MSLILPAGYDCPGLVFPLAGMTITPIIGDLLWCGSAPRDGSDLSAFGGGRGKVFHMEAERVSRGWTGAEVAHYPLEDNAQDKLTAPPTVRGMTLLEVFGVMREVAQRIFDKRPTVVVCRMGLSRSPMIAGGALRLCGESPDNVLRMVRGARGPQALNGGNANFLDMVTAARRI